MDNVHNLRERKRARRNREERRDDERRRGKGTERWGCDMSKTTHKLAALKEPVRGELARADGRCVSHLQRKRVRWKEEKEEEREMRHNGQLKKGRQRKRNEDKRE